MLTIISPAKTLDYQTPLTTTNHTTPELLDQSRILVERARRLSALDIAELMNVSMKIAQLNHERFGQWRTPFTLENSRQALFAFKGEVYSGLDAATLNEQQLEFAQSNMRVLSGLYGVLRPLDLMQPYRLEMGRKIDTDYGKNLYEFWGAKITEALNKQMRAINTRYLVNLASNEYFKAVHADLLDGEIITPEFKDWKGGQYKVIGVYAKKARGKLCRFIIQNKLAEPESLKLFSVDGYQFNPEQSSDNRIVFTRNHT